MARKRASEYAYDIIVNESRLAVDPENLVASLVLRAAHLQVTQLEMAEVLGISPTTYHTWELTSPVLTGDQRERAQALLDWLDLVSATPQTVRGYLEALGVPPPEGDNACSTSGGCEYEYA